MTWWCIRKDKSLLITGHIFTETYFLVEHTPMSSSTKPFIELDLTAELPSEYSFTASTSQLLITLNPLNCYYWSTARSVGIMNSVTEFPQLWEENHFSLSELYLTREPGESVSSGNVGKRFPSLVLILQNKEARPSTFIFTWKLLCLKTWLTHFSSHETFWKSLSCSFAKLIKLGSLVPWTPGSVK